MLSRGCGISKRGGGGPFQYIDTKNKRNVITCGDDSCFVGDNNMVGIADGVGGWAEYGLDSSTVSRTLMFLCYGLCLNQPSVTDPNMLMNSAYYMMRPGKRCAGSTTCCILSFNPSTQMLKSSNLGDSGLMIIRDDKVIYTSEIQSNKNAVNDVPFQLSVLPSQFQNRGFQQNFPHEATNNYHLMEKGDYIILATDGFWDNIPQHVDLGRVVKVMENKQFSLIEMAEYLVSRAKASLLKIDDITIIVNKIT